MTTQGPGDPSRKTVGWLTVVVALAGLLGLLWLITAFLLSVFARATDAYGKVRLPPVSEAVFWGGFAIYGVVMGLVVAVVAPMVGDKGSQLILLAWTAAAVVIPPVMLLVPIPDQTSVGLTTYPSISMQTETIHCGSFYAPKSTDQVCTAKFDSGSRWALTISAFGIVGPVAWLIREAYTKRGKDDDLPTPDE